MRLLLLTKIIRPQLNRSNHNSNCNLSHVEVNKNFNKSNFSIIPFRERIQLEEPDLKRIQLNNSNNSHVKNTENLCEIKISRSTFIFSSIFKHCEKKKKSYAGSDVKQESLFLRE